MLFIDVQSLILVVGFTRYEAAIHHHKGPTPQRALYTALWPHQPPSSEQHVPILQQDPATPAVSRSSFKVRTVRPAAERPVRSLNFDHEAPCSIRNRTDSACAAEGMFKSQMMQQRPLFLARRISVSLRATCHIC